MISPPGSFEGSFADYFAHYVEPNLPSAVVVERMHRALVAYLTGPDPVFFLRYFRPSDRWRSTPAARTPARARGGRVAWTDNSPQWVLHGLALRDSLPPSEELGRWMETSLPCHMFDVKRQGTTLNDFGWHAAHIFDVKDGDTDWVRFDRPELLRRCLLNIHPCNMVLLPKTDWERLGKQKNLLHFALARYRARYGEIIDEALSLMKVRLLDRGESVPTITYAPTRPLPLTMGAASVPTIAHAPTASMPPSNAGARAMPLMAGQAELCRPIQKASLASDHLNWTGNDDSARNHNGAVPKSKVPCDLLLHWKASKKSPEKPIGSFRLDLGGLLRGGYIRLDSRPGCVRLRLFHASDNVIYIQANSQGPRIPLGRVP